MNHTHCQAEGARYGSQEGGAPGEGASRGAGPRSVTWSAGCTGLTCEDLLNSALGVF